MTDESAAGRERKSFAAAKQPYDGQSLRELDRFARCQSPQKPLPAASPTYHHPSLTYKHPQ